MFARSIPSCRNVLLSGGWSGQHEIKLHKRPSPDCPNHVVKNCATLGRISFFDSFAHKLKYIGACSDKDEKKLRQLLARDSSTRQHPATENKKEKQHLINSQNLLTKIFRNIFGYDFFSLSSLKMGERSEAKSAKRSFASKYLKILFLTQSFASRF